MLKVHLSIATLVAVGLLGCERQARAAANAAAGASDVAANTAASGAEAAASAASGAASAAPGHAAPVLQWLPCLTVAFVVLIFLVGVLMTIRSLRKDGTWSLAQALTEKAAAAQPAASSSRLIAFLGSIGMLAMTVGFGLYALWAFFNDKPSEAKDAMQAASSYLLSGSALYAPYAFNQLKSAFKS